MLNKGYIEGGIGDLIVSRWTSFTPRDVYDSKILERLYTRDNPPDKKSEAYQRMVDHVEKLYRFDKLD